ncbi:ER degradation-enhancing alpha-mannosidase-like protein 1 [Eurytemora carolleeae]|uniref:ER degradation-enhancing alpha-mannosidase-like protein 1 n=1 Tax=Eurytemora carolleeae TaxID=1294199 RepID=UPI000C77C9A9|nr:ER degradation-enhancing alpha-mannosidase-like protein 1 [Eurytemora carolleeae]|eukprot:XP_023328035.1 ER degradation-enhancing alpha-mannosidase-like protein 1 [Eurytemora affinis]
MKHAFPLDELNPLDCTGRGPDYENPDNININDVLGDYSLTLIDTLDTLAIIGNYSEFRAAVQRIVDLVDFDKPNDPNFPGLAPDCLSHDLADRLLPAFDRTETGLPFPRVNLKTGLPQDGRTTSCTAAGIKYRVWMVEQHYVQQVLKPDLDGRTTSCSAGVGSLLLEFILLSKLTGDPVYELYARRAVRGIYKLRNQNTGLMGNVVDVNSGVWEGKISGLGAGIDSFYEILLKSFIMYGLKEDKEMFEESYNNIKQYMRRGRTDCNKGAGLHPLYVNVQMESGDTATNWIDIFFLLYKFEINFRPELIESTYLLYQATKNPFYLHVGKDILDSLNNHTRAECGYATVHDVTDMSLEDRQESFFLSETVKYLYLLFDIDNPINRKSKNYVLTTNGHILPLLSRFRENDWDLFDSPPSPSLNSSSFSSSSVLPDSVCLQISPETRFSLPLRNQYLQQIFSAFGVS